jgi:DNA-binding response OmpR family regulator
VDRLADGLQAMAPGLIAQYDLAVLDLGLPGADGMTVLRASRAAGATLPVLLLTARDTSHDRVAGLDAGADDYLVKPFDPPELAARLRALKRRSEGRTSETLRLGRLRMDLAHRELFLDEEPFYLSPREFALTEMLMQRAGRVLNKEAIVAKLSSWESDFSENSVEVYVHRLRKRLAPCGLAIRTVRGFGYVMELDAPAAQSQPA